MNGPFVLTPTEVIAAWIPYDARFRERATRYARSDFSGRRLHLYVDALVNRGNDDGDPLNEEDLRTMAAVREDLERRSLASVDWRAVRERLITGLS